MILRKFRLNGINPLFILLITALNSFGVILYPPVLTQDSIMAGDRIGLGVSIIVPSKTIVTGPETDSDFGRMVIKDRSVNKTEHTSSDSISFNYELALYTTEPCTIPSLKFIVLSSDSLQDTFATEQILLKTVSLVTSDTADLKDVKPQLVTGKPSLAILWISVSAALLCLCYWFLRREIRKKDTPPAPVPAKPPYEEAMDSLRALNDKNLPEKNMIREYVFELSEILKRYAGRRFEVNASEFTTEEMLDWLDTAPVDKSLRRSFEWFLRETDPVKFAKHIPDRNTIKRFGDEALSFIEKTRPVLNIETVTPQNEKTGDSSAVQKS